MIGTFRQREAYRLVYFIGEPKEEVARLMDCSVRNVNALLFRLKKIHPALFPQKHDKKTVSYQKIHESHIKHKF